MKFRMVVRHDKMKNLVTDIFRVFFCFVNERGLKLPKKSEKNRKT